MKKFFWKSDVESYQNEHVLDMALKINLSRGFYLACASAVMEACMIVSFATNASSLFFDQTKHCYLGLYISFFLVSLGMIFILRRARKIASFSVEQRKTWNGILNAFIFFSVTWGTCVTLVDQFFYGQIIAFAINYVVVASMFIMHPRRLAALTAFPIAALYIGLYYTQGNISIVIGDYVNLLVLAVCFTINAFLHYGSFCESEYYKNKAIVLSERDELTGLYNRRSLDRYIVRTYDEANIPPSVVGVIMMDVDNFKTYNDRYGHIAGDCVLRALGDILNETAREENAFPVRYGGEEFLMLLNEKSREQVCRIAEALLCRVRHLHTLAESKIQSEITLSIGAYHGCFKSGDKLWDYIFQADQALYQAKQNGRNRVALIGGIV